MITLRIRLNFPDYADRVGRFVVQAAHKIRERMRQRMTGTRTGRMYLRGKGFGFTKWHRASAKGEELAKDTGKYSQSLNVIRKSSVEAAIESNLVYPFALVKRGRVLAKPSVAELMPELGHDLEVILNQ